MLTPNKQEWNYTYDAFGRWIRKFQVINGTKENGVPLLSGSHSEEITPLSQNKAKIIGYDYVCCGDKLSSEIPLYADGIPNYKDAIHWLYKDDSFTPVARYQQGKVHYVTSDQTVAPRELFTESGKLAWSSRSECWGKLDYLNININNPLKAANDGTVTCQLRFPGQYEGNESGLFYNRHRYYDPETAQYLSPDPIGRMGGINPYGYVHNPTGWVDPLGLVGACNDGKGTNSVST